MSDDANRDPSPQRTEREEAEASKPEEMKRADVANGEGDPDDAEGS